jgi:hypothetical protein
MKVEIDSNNNLVIRIPINKPLVPSKSGKSLVVASSNGNKQTAVLVEGRPVVVGINAYVAIN